MSVVAERGRELAVAPLCAALFLARATFYRMKSPQESRIESRPASPRALSTLERQEVLSTLNSEEYRDLPPAEVYAELLDKQTYLCSIRTMYRILDASGMLRERRDQLTHPPYTKPELMATQPNQLWSWDITKLLGPAKWNYFYLYVILDVFSRYVVGWMVATRESSALAKRLISETCEKHGIERDQLTLHADRGTSMRSKPVAFLLADLGVTKSHSRPYTSTDNPFSEAHFKTMKYRPEFPDRFGCQEDARAFCQPFFEWYNNDHHHSGLGLLTPADVHFNRAGQIIQERQRVLDAAFASHPERFVRRAPVALALPSAVWINPPEPPKREEERN
jgi:putative transposase